MMATNTSLKALYQASIGQLAAESYLDTIRLDDQDSLRIRFTNGNNHYNPPNRNAPRPNEAAGGTKLAESQLVEFFETFDIIDHLPNQASGFSATLLKNKTTKEYTLAFRSTEYRDIENGGDAERDSIRGAAGDVAFNGMAFAQVSSMEKYWQSLVDGTRALGATPDEPAARDTKFLRVTDIEAFTKAINVGTKINVSGYSLGGHLATVFGTLHGEATSSLYLFNSSGVGRIRESFPATAYRDALASYDFYMRPENFDAAILRVLDWASRAVLGDHLGLGARLRIFFEDPKAGWPFSTSGRPFLPQEFRDYVNLPLLPMTAVIGGLVGLAGEQAVRGMPRGADKLPVMASSALHFLVSLFASEALDGTYVQTVQRGLGMSFPSLQESGLIPADVKIYQVSGRAAAGASSNATFRDMAQATDWNIVADSGVRAAPDAQLVSIYIEDQPIASGLPFSDRGWGDFGNTHSITLIVDSLAVIRMLQKAQPSLSQEAAEQVLRAASNLRKQLYKVYPPAALAEHDTLERVVDAFGRLLFGRLHVGNIDWSTDLPSADGVSSFGLLAYRDPFHARIRAIENEVAARGLAEHLQIVSLAGWSSTDIVAAAAEASDRGKAARYALKELNGFYVLGSGLYDSLGRDTTLALHDPATGTGSITNEWLQDRAEFLALKLRLGTADHAYALGNESIAYSTASGEVALSIAGGHTAGLLAPESPMSKTSRSGLVRLVESLAASGQARKIMFGADGDPAANPATVPGGADTLTGKAGSDRLYGEGGNDKLFGGAGADYLEGGVGDDDLFGGTGSDVLAGGLGYDSYFWTLGDGFDRIVETREASGEVRGRIVLRLDTQLLVPRLFKRDDSASTELWRSPDRSLLLAHGATWVLSFLDGEIDLGPDLRDGDFGFRLEGSASPPPPTVFNGAVFDSAVVGPNAAGAILVGEYGHDRLYTEAPIALEAALLLANAAPSIGWGFWLTAGPGDDVAIASAAADIVVGGGGMDTLLGGPGDDLMDGDADQVPVLNGNHLRWDYRPDTLDGYFTEFYAPGFVTTGTGIFTELFRDQIDEGADVLYGGGGNDRMYGGDGDDLLYGDPGDDLLVGGAGADMLFGGDGADRITGELHGYARVPFETIDGLTVTYPYYVSAYGDDIIDGGAGADVLTGEGGADVLFGGEGDDTIYADVASLPGALHGNDVADGGAGDDEIYGQGGDDLLLGGSGNDRLIGDSDIEAHFHGADSIQGDEGDDLLIGAGGADRLFGGSEADTLIGDAHDVPAEFHGADVLDGGPGDDVLYGFGGADELFGAEGSDRLYGDDPDGLFPGHADLLDGGAGDDVLHGQAGDDRLQGGSDNDTLFGEAGNDTLVGGPGSDVLDGGSGDNVYEFVLGDGVDRVIAGAGLTTVYFVEGIELSAVRASRDLNSPVGTAPLQIQYSPTDIVTIEALADPNRLQIEIGDAETLSGTELLRLTESLARAMAGSGASEILFGHEAGTDLFALNGDDVLVGSGAADMLHGGAGDDELYGLGGNDTLLGGQGADRLLGGSGDDRLEGGPGDDRYEFSPGEGADSLIEASNEGFDVVKLLQDTPLESVRLRRAGNDLVVAERAGSGRLFVRDWYAAGEADPGIDAIEHEGGTLDVEAIRARELVDRTLLGTSGADTLTGDEFGDIVMGGTGDDLLAGLAGDDRYVYARGDGNDRIADTGGFDTVEFGAGIEPGEIEFVGSPDGTGGLSIALRLAGASGELVFGEAHTQRIDAFRFASGEVLDYASLLRRVGGLRIQGGDDADLVPGTFLPDALYGFAGDDMLLADPGEDWLVGAEGNDFLAGGANDDTYVFNLGDGRDVIVEYDGSDEYLLFRGYFTASGHRAFDLDGTTFATHEPLPGAFGETFNISLGSVAGGVDTIRFGEGIAPEDIRFGLDLGKPLRPYSWLVEDATGGLVPGTVQAEQVAYILEIGTSGDAIELLWPDVEVEEHAAQSFVDSAPMERLIFGESEPVTLAEVFASAGGLVYLIGTSQNDTLDAQRILTDGWLAGGAGNDRYLRPEQLGLGILETEGGGTDTIVLGDGVSRDHMQLRLEQERLFLLTGAGRIEFLGFDSSRAERTLIEHFEFADETSLSYAALLSRGIHVAGTPFNDHLFGTSAYDLVQAGSGNDVVASSGGDDIIDAGDGADTIEAGDGDDWMNAGAGDDVIRGGPGRDRYHFARGSGNDTIEENGIAGEADTLELAADITPEEVTVRRVGGDMVLELAEGGGRINVRDWFSADAMRVENVQFHNGTQWDVSALAALAGEPLPVGDPVTPTDPPTAPPADPPAEPPVVAGPPADPPPSEPVSPPLNVESPEIPASPPSSADVPLPTQPLPVGATTVTATPPTRTLSATASAPVFELTMTTAVSTRADSVAVASGEAFDPVPGSSIGAEPAQSPSANGLTEATIESLAAAGFVSPGRPSAAPAESGVETIDAEAPMPEEAPAEAVPDDSGSAAIAAYWRWMHARLDEHLEQTQVDDLGTPVISSYPPFTLSSGSALDALEPSRSVGIRDRAAFDARAFDGLRDGFVHLG